ncbi:proteobacterial dedicated sortase system histidine kinase [Pseudocolwellia agarivorans]|uniref:proteobacterial dedicated sortase system histidine kinase n=1 Tax=Pseudocolwellia agarivorans TaxID=1911682 RepID=UPI00098676FF|nr:proteobacterial dedicated sortase system histidine kinase [Pseudocolwellia agarivorans]
MPVKNKSFFRFGLRIKLLLLSSFLFSLPWFGYQYVWEMEKYLRYGQEQTIVGTARALATALHERPNLFNNQASFLPNVEKGKDLYSYKLTTAIQLDGLPIDWPLFNSRAHYYGEKNQLSKSTSAENSLHFNASVGQYDKYLYMMFTVVDNQLIYRHKNARGIFKNDHLEIGLVDPQNHFNRFIISNKKAGWLDAYKVETPIIETDPFTQTNPTNPQKQIITVAPKIQGHWLETPQGYNVELRIPMDIVGDNIAFAFHDVDTEFADELASVGSANPSTAQTLGTVLVPSPEIERIVKGMSYTNSSVWVVDQHQRVLAKAGNLKQASGVWNKRTTSHSTSSNSNDSMITSLWNTIEQNWLLPLYYKFLTKPPKDFIDELYDAQHLTGKHIKSALQGNAHSQWRLTTDQQAVVLSAAYPIYINNQVHGAVIVEETTNGIRTLRNRALEKLFTSIIAIMLLGATSFFLFASRISNRIRTLRNQAESSIDENGRINNQLVASTANDEIGDLSRSFSTAVNRLSQYNHYLEGMSSRLSHELRTPIAVVRTSLENLTMQQLPDSTAPYIERAQTGINTLNLILTNMSEATNLEQMLETTERVPFNLQQVLFGCVQGYKQIYTEVKFSLTGLNEENARSKAPNIEGSPEHIAQLLDKVFANAVEFSNDNKVSISLQETSSTFIIHISNNGKHLPELMKDRLFDSMVSMRDTKRQAQPHLGLGLYIARLIVEFHQGSISANDHHNPSGVTLSITLNKI